MESCGRRREMRGQRRTKVGGGREQGRGKGGRTEGWEGR